MSNQDLKPIDFEPYFGGFILETLTIGMYDESRNAIREYLQNAFDSIQKAIDKNYISSSESKVEVSILGNKMIILDNGIGIPSSIAASTLVSIGASRKNYSQEAGFRGIGRLAGIAFSDVVQFRTKAKGDTKETIVKFEALNLRKSMSPNSSLHVSLSELLRNHVKTSYTYGNNPDEHYFEVILEGFSIAAPVECSDFSRLYSFISQVAPVPYRSEFSFKDKLAVESKNRNFEIEEINVFIKQSKEDIGAQVFKPYGDKYVVKDTPSPISDFKFCNGKHWWGWVGSSNDPGAFKSEESRGIRVRVRNIQIDGTQIIGNIFAELPGRTSYDRFNDWYIGEIFINPSFLVPNARRDAFEDDENWLITRKEFAELCEELGRRAYAISKQHQQSLKKLVEDVRKLEATGKDFFSKEKTTTDDLISFSNDLTKTQRLVTRALKRDDFESIAQLRSLENRLIDLKSRAVQRLGTASKSDEDQIRIEAQNELLQLLIEVFRDNLDPKNFAEVAGIIATHFDYPPTSQM